MGVVSGSCGLEVVGWKLGLETEGRLRLVPRVTKKAVAATLSDKKLGWEMKCGS